MLIFIMTSIVIAGVILIASICAATVGIEMAEEKYGKEFYNH